MSMVEDFIAITHSNFERTNFTSQLFLLVFKADAANLERLSKAFPNEVELFHWWRGSPKIPKDDQIREFVKRWEPPFNDELPLVPGPEAA